MRLTLLRRLLSPFLGFPVSQHSPQSALDDVGVGVYGQGTMTFVGNLDLTIGARVDHESKEALLETFYTPEVAPPTVVSAERELFESLSAGGARVPVSARPDGVRVHRTRIQGGRLQPGLSTWQRAYNEELTWHVEGGTEDVVGGGGCSPTRPCSSSTGAICS